MKKYLAFVLAVLLVGACLSGCGEEPQPQTSGGMGFDGHLALGDSMPELELTTAAGEKYTLSEVLEEKKLVVLNFWFENCPWCLKEFPVMELAYQRHREDVEIFAVNPEDSKEQIGAFVESKGYSFPMTPCNRELALAFGVTGYPTSVFIDRNGVVSLIHTGAITDVSVLDAVLETFTAEDYQSKVYTGIQELL